MGKSSLSKKLRGMLPNITIMLTGILLTIFWPNIWNHILFKQFELKPGTFIHKSWKDQPLQHIDIYFFNWTNPEDFTNHSIKPKFEEVGPYRYELRVKKVNVTYHDNSTVSYKKLQRFNFLPDQSRGKLTDLITTPNIIALCASNQANSFNIFKLKGVEMSLAFFGQEIHVTKTLSEMLFEGYEDSMVAIGTEIGKIMGYEVPFENRFGWMHKRNESTVLSTLYTVDTTTSNLDQLRYWTGLFKPKFLETNCSSYIGASGGELFPPDLIKSNKKVSLYSEDMCRNLDLDFEQDTEVNGIAGKKFISGERMIDNGTKFPDNACHCNGECVPSGVLNLTSCRLGNPMFMSYPHFFLGDQFYLDQIEGMNPIKEKHEFYTILEPTTSLPLEAKARVQLNILVKPLPRIKMYRNVQTKFLPILWMEQSFELDNQMTFMVKLMLWTPFIGQMIGCVTIIISTYLIYRLSQSSVKEEKQEYIDENENNKEIKNKKLPELSPLVNCKNISNDNDNIYK
ncbi:unnamed protein product [Chironomus riparius]|uniref:Uncharacterized protein n=1 Tax=Chironomus riparius TaxID=315576 RepID=A0A9P0NFE6_9DIPT|nr:unnamed protein product [Chironomus riparius]